MNSSQTLDAENLKALIDERSLTRSQVSRAAGISESYLSRIINGHIRVNRPRLIESLAESLGVEPDELMRGGQVVAVRVAAPPHLWSAPFFNVESGGGDDGVPRFELLEVDQAFTGAESLEALRRGDADLALAFETPLSLTGDSDVVPLGSICAGPDFVRLLLHRDSPLLEEFERLAPGDLPGRAADRGSDLPERWRCRPTAAIHGQTIAADYLRHLEQKLPDLERVLLVPPCCGRKRWQDDQGLPLHLILIWEPVASAIVAATGGEFVDVFDAFADRLPTMWLPRPAEYQLLISLERPLSKHRLHTLIIDLHAAVLGMNHFIGSSKLVLGNQPVFDRLIATLGEDVDDGAAPQVRPRLVRRLAATTFRLRIRPEPFTRGLL